MNRLIGMGLLLVMLSMGCDRGPVRGEVEGTVKLDGNPVPQVAVTFHPENGPTSMGITDADGRYVLMYDKKTPGIVPGEHRVTLETGWQVAKRSREIFPPQFNHNTTLVRTVTEGQQTIDFDLQSK